MLYDFVPTADPKVTESSKHALNNGRKQSPSPSDDPEHLGSTKAGSAGGGGCRVEENYKVKRSYGLKLRESIIDIFLRSEDPAQWFGVEN